VRGATVGAALDELAERYPQLRQHLFNEDGELRSFVNVFVNSEDVRYLRRTETPLSEGDTVRIVPSIAGGRDTKVDHTALKVNQAFIIALLIGAFIANSPWLVAFVAAVMLIGTIWPQAALFKAVYTYGLKRAGWLKPHAIPDNPEPHLFAQGLGGVFLALSSVALIGLNNPVVGWALAWLVVGLAALNLFAGFCAGCFVYYQLNRLHVPGFTASPVERK
jgi:molybdopterin converting factor small subunit